MKNQEKSKKIGKRVEIISLVVELIGFALFALALSRFTHQESFAQLVSLGVILYMISIPGLLFSEDIGSELSRFRKFEIFFASVAFGSIAIGAAVYWITGFDLQLFAWPLVIVCLLFLLSSFTIIIMRFVRWVCRTW